MTVFEEVYLVVGKIPHGKVTTYGAIAKKLGLKDSRIIGWALHRNRNPQIPCHRVVNRQGKLAPGYVFGGAKKQKEKLKQEGVRFLKNGRVDLRSHFWKP